MAQVEILLYLRNVVFHFQNNPLWNTSFHQIYWIDYIYVVCQLVSLTKEYRQYICNITWSFQWSLIFSQFFKFCHDSVEQDRSKEWYCQNNLLRSIHIERHKPITFVKKVWWNVFKLNNDVIVNFSKLEIFNENKISELCNSEILSFLNKTKTP